MRFVKNISVNKSDSIVFYFLIFSLSVIFICNTFTIGADANDSEASSNSWMSHVDDNLKLSEMNIPGTHDSGTEYTDWAITGIVASCQSDSISTQLKKGIRYLDLRINTDMEINHGGVLCYTSWFTIDRYKLTLKKVLDEVVSFLEKNPTETVIIQVKKEGDSKDETRFQNSINSLLSNYSLLYNKSVTSKDLTMGQLRGKFVVFSREWGINSAYRYYSWPDDCEMASTELDNSSAVLQDKYNEHTGEGKLEVIESFYEDIWSQCGNYVDKYVVNFTSCVGPYIPKLAAVTVNSKFENFVNKNHEEKFGIVLMDNPDKDLIASIYETNF